ncbi:RDD family protein [Dyella sp.]|uniref:RDD family protein n=1 Tax=Dyella sp. TaxID=1869338 RepID=UPI002B476F67|nr:RDD family protein [Dyella sp.]HKT29876.1 RDD family protein [Dyella sp.]
METNPYAAPGAVVDDAPLSQGGNLEARKATRGQRLGAALLDGVIIAVCVMPFIFIAAVYRDVNSGLRPAIWPMLAGLIGFGLVIGVFVYNCILLSRNGQTIGKRTLNIKIVRSNGEAVTLSRVIFLRWLPVALMGAIPIIGRFIGLADSLVIFGNEKRCIHDYIADTIVIVD